MMDRDGGPSSFVAVRPRHRVAARHPVAPRTVVREEVNNVLSPAPRPRATRPDCPRPPSDVTDRVSDRA